MSEISENVRQVLIKLLPAHILNDVQCYVFYDDHPKDEKHIDITVYTKSGEVREYYQRDLLSFVGLENLVLHTEIKIMRNSRSELFYLLAGGGELTILSRKDKLQVHQRLTEVSRYEISDPACCGEAILKVIHQYSDIPVVPDNNFENFKPIDFTQPSGPLQHGSVITHLMRKLMEAKYSVKCNETSLKDFINIRQNVAFSIYKKIHPNLNESLFKDGLEGIANALKVNTCKPWIKTCNKKIVIVHDVCNGNEEPLEEIHILLHGTERESIEYTTKIFQKTSAPPFWNELQTQMLAPAIESAIVLVIDLKELKDNAMSRIEFCGVIVYRKSGKEGLLPIENITVSSLDTLGEQFDVMCSDLTDTKNVLAVLATTEKTDLIFRHIKRVDEPPVTIDVFCEYLKMEQIPNANNILIHRKSPYHVLNGVIILLETEIQERSNRLAVSVYSRSSAQVLALIHHIQDAVPLRILITTPAYKITSKSDIFSSYNEKTLGDSEQGYNHMNYATSMLNRTGLVLEYLDQSMIKMSESKNSVVLNKIGSEIDLFAQGEASYQEFKKIMRAEAATGVEKLEDGVVLVAVSDEMCVD